MKEKKRLPVRGADVSQLKQIEDCGGRFYHQGREEDCLRILQSHGINYLRLKIWNDPGPGGYNGRRLVMETARRIKAAGFKLLLDFHYSDFWADPNTQTPPRAWQALSYPELKEAVRLFTGDIVSSLCRAGAPPDMVQIGNEIDNGFLWEQGRLDGSERQWERFAGLLRSGIRGVREGAPSSAPIPVMIHKANGCDRAGAESFFDNVFSRGAAADIIGFSFYPFFHGTFEALAGTLAAAALRYEKDILVVETAWGWTGEDGDDCPNLITGGGPVDLGFSAAGQMQFLKKIAAVLELVPRGKGRGFFYWEPCFIPVAGAGWKNGEGDQWDNMTLFDFHGNALPSLDVFLDI